MDFLCSSARTRHKVTRRGNNTQINCWNKSLHTGCPLLPCHASRHPFQFSSLPLPLPSLRSGMTSFGRPLDRALFCTRFKWSLSKRRREGVAKGREGVWHGAGRVMGNRHRQRPMVNLRAFKTKHVWESLIKRTAAPRAPFNSPFCLANGISATWLCHLSALRGLVYLHLSIWICLVVFFFYRFARSSQRNEKERKENSKAKVKVKDNVGPGSKQTTRRQRQARRVWGK